MSQQVVLDADVLLEDNHLIAIKKKAGVLVQGDQTGDEPLSESVKTYLREKYDKPGNVFTGVIHRIDRPVSGVVLFAKTSKALARMNAQFSEKSVKKVYWALVEGVVEKEQDDLEHFLIKDGKTNKSRASIVEKKGFKKSVLSYRILCRLERFTLLEVKPITGRHHQIRVQLAAIGHPIKGDLKYGAKRSNTDSSISLHARRLTFNHPVQQTPVVVDAMLPDTDIWPTVKSVFPG